MKWQYEAVKAGRPLSRGGVPQGRWFGFRCLLDDDGRITSRCEFLYPHGWDDAFAGAKRYFDSPSDAGRELARQIAADGHGVIKGRVLARKKEKTT